LHGDFDGSAGAEEEGRPSDDAYVSESRCGAPGSVAQLRFEVFGVLDGADFDVGLAAGFVAAEAGDPDFAVADHGTFGVDEEGVVFLFEDGVLNVGGDDAVVVLDELLFGFDGEGFFAGVDLDGVVDEFSDSGGVVFGDGLLEIGKDLVDFGVVANGEIDGFVVVGGGLGRGEVEGDNRGGDEEETREVGADGHSISFRASRVVSRTDYRS
jgi:hypothetical protein